MVNTSFATKARAAFTAFWTKLQPGRRSYGWYGNSDAGVWITEENAMRFAAVQACVRVLSEDIAALPIHVYKRLSDGGKESARDHPLYPLLHDAPNPEMSAVSFWEAIMVNLLLGGNAYAFKEFNNAGRVKALWPLLHSEVTPQRDSKGVIVYKIGSRDFSESEILHIPGLSYDGLLGLSPIAYARGSIGLGIAAENFGARYFGNGTHLGGVITVPGELSEAGYKRTQQEFVSQYKGLQNAHGIPILEGGATFTPVTVAPEDAQFLETRKYQRTEIAAIFRVPLHLIGDLERATFSNIEHQDQSYLQRSLLPWLMRIEQCSMTQLLSESERSRFIIEHDTSNFLRGDTQSRFNAYSVGIQNGILTPNEARARENLNPLKGGDDIMLPLNMSKGSEGKQEQKPQLNQKIVPHKREELDHDHERRAIDIKDALQALGVSCEDYEELRESFGSWLSEQASEILKLAEGAEGEELIKQIRDYYERSAKPTPEGIRRAARRITDNGLARAKARVPQSPELDENWREGYMDRYEDEMNERLLNANRDEAERAAGLGALGFAFALGLWGYDRAQAMARDEASIAMNQALAAGYRKAGYTSRWKALAAECPACQALNGRTITTLRPPLHRGCSCMVDMGEKY